MSELRCVVLFCLSICVEDDDTDDADDHKIINNIYYY
jgi:hypothetical protein